MREKHPNIKTLNVGLIGCGAIGTTLAEAIDDGRAGKIKLIIVHDSIIQRSKNLIRRLSKKPKIAKNPEQLIKNKNVDLIIEAASQDAVRQYAEKVLRADKDLMIMSVGALVDYKLFRRVRSLAEKTGRRIYVPSGAIAGLDGVRAAAIGKINEVILTTRKPPKGLKDAPFIQQEKIDLDAVSVAKKIYEGPALEACKLFPNNVNVAAALSLAGIGPERTIVRMVADPGISRNIHEISVRGEFGELKVRVENVPSPENPKTSYLAAVSAIASLRKITENVLVGT